MQRGVFKRKKVALASTPTPTRATKQEVIDVTSPLLITYRVGCDISGLDEQVRKRLNYNTVHIKTLQLKANELSDAIDQANSVARLRALEIEQAKLLTEIHRLTHNSTLENYLKESLSILDQINVTSTEVCVLDVMAKDCNNQFNREQLEGKSVV